MYCTHCGTQLSTQSNFCSNCAKPVGAPPRPASAAYFPDSMNKDLRHVIPTATPMSAFAAGYLGLFSILMIPAPFAIIFGIIGLRQIKAKPERYGHGRCWTGIILGSIFSILILILVIASIIQ